ncbi:MAG: S9 family peptidase [Candidatus Krumholzibacteriota bacterium]|nr:S9 family peptidase [Candidatus Krumholzibacteriota bacterium]
MKSFPKFYISRSLLILTLFSFVFTAGVRAGEPVSPEDALNLKRSYTAVISPEGKWIAYTLNVPRAAEEEAGGAYSELYLVETRSGEIRPFITGKVNISSPRFSPCGKMLAFLTRRGEKAKTQVWMIPVDGGESIQLTKAKTDVSFFRWHPEGGKIAYIATDPTCEKQKKYEDKGYRFIYFEENLRHRNLYMVDIDPTGPTAEAEQLTKGVTVWSFEFNPCGKKIAAAVSEKNLVDHSYMFKKVHLLDIASRELTRLTENPGKLGNFAFSLDGGKLAFAAALKREDHAVSQVFVIDIKNGELLNLTEPDFRGHVSAVGWKDEGTVFYTAGEGVWNTLNLVPASGGKRKVIRDGKKEGLVFNHPHYTKDFKHFALVGNSPEIPGDIYYWKFGSRDMKRLTTFNPWIAERELGRQEVITYPARDGWRIEGILVYPVGYREGERYPLIVGVHGGPEAHHRNAWIGSYFNPAQVLSGKGYAVFYPNYRASTGYGLKFALAGYMDAAGGEFDDIADGIDYLVSSGLADPERVGLGGGSYGGFASAWFATYYTEKVRAVCMFVGISDLVSKRGTTDIPYEELYVHSGKKLDEDWDMWEFSIKRSPIYYAKQSRTAVLIIGGAADPRVHPSQSLEFYRRLKMNDHPAVRLVQYPGEGHGNRKQPGRIDVLHRHLQWYDWYVKDKKPLDGPLPPLLIFDSYGIDLETE